MANLHKPKSHTQDIPVDSHFVKEKNKSKKKKLRHYRGIVWSQVYKITKIVLTIDELENQ